MSEEKKIKKIPGRKQKYDFEDLLPHTPKLFTETSIAVIIGCSKHYIKNKNLTWKIKCWSTPEGVYIMRLR